MPDHPLKFTGSLALKTDEDFQKSQCLTFTCVNNGITFRCPTTAPIKSPLAGPKLMGVLLFAYMPDSDQARIPYSMRFSTSSTSAAPADVVRSSSGTRSPKSICGVLSHSFASSGAPRTLIASAKIA